MVIKNTHQTISKYHLNICTKSDNATSTRNKKADTTMAKTSEMSYPPVTEKNWYATFFDVTETTRNIYYEICGKFPVKPNIRHK